MQPSIVFSDLDGTFVATDKSVPPLNWDILDELRHKNIEFVPCTGRSFSGLSQEILENDAVHYAVVANGASVVDVRSSQPIYSMPLAKKYITELYELVGNKDITFDLFTEGQVMSERRRYDRLDTFGVDPHNLRLIKSIRQPVDMSVPEMLEQYETIDRITIMFKDIQDKKAILDYIDKNNEVAWVSSGSANLEISSSGASKGNALVWLCNYLGVDVARSIAFGDSLNDLSMIKAAGDGVAMDEASPVLIQACDHRAGSNDEAGVALYLKNLID